MAQQEGGSASGPTVLRILLGAQLRKLREGKGVTRDEAGWRENQAPWNFRCL